MQEKIVKNLSKINRKIIVMSGKGGVGKSTVCVNIATALARRKNRVGILDVDIHGPNIPKMLHVEDEQLSADESGIIPVKVNENMVIMSMAYLLDDKDTAIIWRGPMKMSVVGQFIGEVQWGELDYLVVDLPPGTGDESLSIVQQIPDGEMVIVTTPQEVALLDCKKSINFAKKLEMKILGLVENMSGFSCPHCKKEIQVFKTGGGEKTANETGIPFLGRLPMDPAFAISGDEGIPEVLNNGQLSKSINGIVDRIEE